MWPIHSQATLKKEQTIKTIVDSKGDTLIQMSISDAKFILKVLLQKEINDSLLIFYTVKDSVNQNIIMIYQDKINLLIQIVANLETKINVLEEILANKDKEIKILNTTIKEQEKEITKQKVLKFLGFSGCLILPLLTLFIFR